MGLLYRLVNSDSIHCDIWNIDIWWSPIDNSISTPINLYNKYRRLRTCKLLREMYADI